MGRTVLIVASSDSVQGLVGRALMENGCRVVATNHVKQAWGALETDSPHLLVVDLPAQNTEIVKFLGIIRTLPDWQHVPVILLADQPQMQQASKLNPTQIIVRDENLEGALIEVVKKLFTVTATEDEAPRSMLF